jgi:hypothetical protein
LPLPPIGVHKILAKQLRMDEWRVHVAIGLIRKQMAMPRWNEDRDDLPPQMKEQLKAVQAAAKEAEKEGGNGAAAEAEAEVEAEEPVAKPKKKAVAKTKKKAVEVVEVAEEEDDDDDA